MAEFLVIRIAAERDAAAHWIAVDGNGTRTSPPVTGPLAEAVKDIGDRDVIVLVPAATVLTTNVDIPVRGASRLRAALPFALEEHLADDIDELHFAAGMRRDSGLVPVAVVSHQHMLEWLERLDAADIRPAQIIPENYGLARIPGTLSLLAAEDQVMFNDGGDNEFIMQGVKPSDVLAVAGVLDDVGSGEAPADEVRPGHLLAYCDPADEERFQHDWTALRHEMASVDINLLPDGVLPRLLLTLGVVGLGGKVVDTYRLSQEEAALKAQFTEEYRQIRPGDTNDVVDPVATVNSLQRALGSPTAATVFLPSLHQLGIALQQNDAAEIEAISYRAGIIDVRLTAPDVATLDSIQKIVSGSGRFNASIQSTDQLGDKVSSRIQIREAGA
jgi:general secretion pathway protein L